MNLQPAHKPTVIYVGAGVLVLFVLYHFAHKH